MPECGNVGNSVDSIVTIIKAFLAQGDISIAAAQDLESRLEQTPETATNQQVASLMDLLASYRPGGGPMLYDQAQLERSLRALLRHLIGE